MRYITFSPRKIAELLTKLTVKPRDYLGQHFLISNSVAERIVLEAHLTREDTVLEVGPGLGILTQELSKCAGRVIAVEKDRALGAYLLKDFAGENVEIVPADILDAAHELPRFKLSGYSIVSNLPYGISGRFLSTFMAHVLPKPERIVVMLQKEVAEKLVAKPGDMTKLSVLAQTYGTPRVCFTVTPPNFYPQPSVHSAVVSIPMKKILPHIFPQHEDIFWRLVRISFSSKRKMLYRNLSNGLHVPVDGMKKLLKMAHIKENARAQELSVESWVTLVDKYTENY